MGTFRFKLDTDAAILVSAPARCSPDTWLTFAVVIDGSGKLRVINNNVVDRSISHSSDLNKGYRDGVRRGRWHRIVAREPDVPYPSAAPTDTSANTYAPQSIDVVDFFLPELAVRALSGWLV